MVSVKQPTFIEKARLSKQLVSIQCHMCKSKRLVHAYSYCWQHTLCNQCANREFQDSEIFGREQHGDS